MLHGLVEIFITDFHVPIFSKIFIYLYSVPDFHTILIKMRSTELKALKARRIVIVRDHSLDSWDIIRTKSEIYKVIRQSRSIKRKNVGLDTLPKEVLMNILFPFFDMKSLYDISKVNTKWERIAKNYIRDFNRIVQMTVNNDNRNVFKFTTRNAQKLEKLSLKWATGQESCSDILVDVLEQSNNLKGVHHHHQRTKI